ncbi:hypothetical protein BN2475_570049 [Paraburkholderia ribeironis]|uniref:Uncharacterized protein n=1 Tax=Paraburkholderia ribeironis TaxID=1247936 RepID=A0A1N7SF09_9BURK|nr:hypothetical protein BN2475_570049 [Paraburkholderia ribeironis]
MIRSMLIGAAQGFLNGRWRGQREAFVEPAGHAAGHQLDGAAQLGETQCAARRAVAMRARAIRDEERVGRIVGELRRDDLAVGQVERAWHVALREQRRAAHVEQHEAGGAARERGADVGAIRFELQRCLEVCERGGAIGGGNGGDGVGSRHIGSKGWGEWDVRRSTIEGHAHDDTQIFLIVVVGHACSAANGGEGRRASKWRFARATGQRAGSPVRV